MHEVGAHCCPLRGKYWEPSRRMQHGDPSLGSLGSVSIPEPSSARAPVRNEWQPQGPPVREEWYAAKCSRKEADEKSKLYENRIGMLHKKRERALRMLEMTRAREKQLQVMRETAEIEADERHHHLMLQNHQRARDHRDARNMVQSARAGCHIKQVLTQDRNTGIKRQMNEVKDAWKQERLDKEAKDFSYRKGIHDHIQSTDRANPRAAMHAHKQSNIDRTREHLYYELDDHSRVLSSHDSKMDAYQSIEHSMIENVNKAQGDGKQAQDALEQSFIRSESSYRVDRLVRSRLKDQPLPPDREWPFTPRPG